ncbi:MAG: class I SAM-dependent methyltransferase [Nitrospiraceae bacterium]|nr:MAG: class I SAM-dependent methyltransferase [Nitrospiraceae bacterium]
MNEKELYERQYGEKKISSVNSFPLLRMVLKRFDLHREDLAISLLDGGEKMLDVGCGNGSLVFKARGKFKEVFGIDISPSRIEEAKINAVRQFRNLDGMSFSSCNINEKIDFPDNMFDAATSIAVIEHVFDPYFVIGEIRRVLRPGGIFIGEVPNIAYIRQRIHLLCGKLPVTSSPYNWKEIGWDGGHLHYFTKKTFCRLIEESGFRILEVSGSGLLAQFRNFYPSLLTGDICVKAQKC